MMRSFWIIALVCVVSTLAADLTLEEKAVGSEVVEAVIDVLESSCVFSDDRQMLRRIAKLETDDGNADDTFFVADEEYYGGIWRVSETMLLSAQTRADLFVKVQTAFDIDLSKVVYRDLMKPLYSGLIARIFIDTNPVINNVVPWDAAGQALYWATTYHHSNTASVQTQAYLDVLDQLDSEDAACNIPQADIVFVLDGSGSIGAGNFEIMLQFVENVVDAFDVRNRGVRIGVIKYSAKSKSEFYLGEITGKSAVKTEVRAIKYETGGTNTAAALDDLREMFASYGRGRGVPQIGIVITDGQSMDEAATARAAQKVHDEKLTVFAVGVTSGVNTKELQTIGTDPDCIHVHYLESFTDIVPFTSTIQSQACKAPAELTPGLDWNFGSVITGQRVFFKLRLRRNKNGATIRLKMRSGGGRLFVSFKARNPGRAVFKYQLRIDSTMLDGGRMHIQFPSDLDSSVEFVDAFVALMGEGFGSENLYDILMQDGAWNAGSETKPMMLSLMLGVLLAFVANM